MIENPTEKQLRTLKGIVYIITNQINGKVYIGKTIHRFVDRYSNCKWWRYPSNKYLKNSIKKHGKENFKLSILTYGINDDNELLTTESDFIRQYNCLFPNGYNFLEETGKGRIFTEEMRLNIALAGCKKKIYRIKEIATGEIKEFRCPKEIIDRYKTNHANLADLFNKKQNTVKGICLPETNPEIRKNGGGLKTVVDQYGTIYEFYNPNKFCRENQCGKETIRRLIKGVCLTVKSKDGRIFRLENTILNSMEYLRSIKLMNVNQKYKQIILTRISDNKDFTINMPDYIKEFCKNNDIYKREIYALTNKEQKTAKGFKLKEVIYL
jgi:group I intron endonuclease